MSDITVTELAKAISKILLPRIIKSQQRYIKEEFSKLREELLNENGKIDSDYSINELSDDEFWDNENVMQERKAPIQKRKMKLNGATNHEIPREDNNRRIQAARKKAHNMIGKMGPEMSMIESAGEYDVDVAESMQDRRQLAEAGTVDASEVSGKELAAGDIDPSALDYSKHMERLV